MKKKMGAIEALVKVMIGIIVAFILQQFIVSLWPTVQPIFGNAEVSPAGAVNLFILGILSMIFLLGVMKIMFNDITKPDSPDRRLGSSGGSVQL